MQEKFTYEIGGKKYTQRALVLGQTRQLKNVIEGIVIPKGIKGMGETELMLAIVGVVGDKLPDALAVVLTPEGVELKDKDLKALAREIEFAIPPDQAFQVIEDFFDCNPIASLLERLSGAIGKIAEKIPAMGSGSKILSASSPAEISREETVFSGDTPMEIASHTLSTEAEK